MAWESGIAGRWEVSEDGYEEQIVIPKEGRDWYRKQTESDGTNNEFNNGRILPWPVGLPAIGFAFRRGGRAITGNQQTRLPLQGTSGQVYLPTEMQEMLKESGRIRIQILGG